MNRATIPYSLCVAGLFNVATLLIVSCHSHSGEGLDAGSAQGGEAADSGKPSPAMAGHEATAGNPGTQGSDAGGTCVSSEGGPCGGNTRNPCSCGTGLVCAATPGSTLPMGDVGGTCQKAQSSGSSACQTSADCQLQADYCTGCDCVALGPGEKLRACPGAGVSCLVDPCGSKSAQCVSGKCVAH